MFSTGSIRGQVRVLKTVRTWQLVLLLLVMLFVSATLLRLNSIGMMQRREAVLVADEQGDETTIENRLYELQRYVSTHMNTDTGPVYLENQYKRNAQKIIDEAKNDTNPNGNVQLKADAVCRPQFSSWSPAYVQCFAEELAKYPPSPDPAQDVSIPSTELYRHTYAAPIWSADPAGFSVLVCIMVCVVIVGRLLALVLLRALVKRRMVGI